ncbi:coproporphyrinogen III oxidase [Enterococcus mundtii]|uniref:Coproporphyrinogen III oxidase n=1 Tax=Enterococcus mundtii TaxID=53346 RepID=A0AAI8WCL4_ENTMU|nr:coproporphyrinogen III oxidase [Enterococcus mundtii]
MKETNKSAEHKVSAYIHIPFCEHICYYCDLNVNMVKMTVIFFI